jgi:hypothetical protein
MSALLIVSVVITSLMVVFDKALTFQNKKEGEMCRIRVRVVPITRNNIGKVLV